MDRWILSRAAALAEEAGARLADYDALGATRRISTFIDDLSTWYLRLSRRRFSRSDERADRDAAFATLHEALVSLARVLAPLLPFLAESMYGNLVAAVDPDRARLRPPDPLAGRRAGSTPRAGPRGGDGDRPPRGRARADAPRDGRAEGPPAARPALARAARRRPAGAGSAPRPRSARRSTSRRSSSSATSRSSSSGG